MPCKTCTGFGFRCLGLGLFGASAESSSLGGFRVWGLHLQVAGATDMRSFVASMPGPFSRVPPLPLAASDYKTQMRDSGNRGP